MEKRSRRDLTHDARTDPKGRIPPHLFNFCSNHFSAGSDKDLVGYAATEAERSAMDSHEAGGAARRAKKLQLRAGIDAERGHSCAQPSTARDALHLQAFPRPGVGKRKACLINVLHAAVLAFCPLRSHPISIESLHPFILISLESWCVIWVLV